MSLEQKNAADVSIPSNEQNPEIRENNLPPAENEKFYRQMIQDQALPALTAVLSPAQYAKVKGFYEHNNANFARQMDELSNTIAQIRKGEKPATYESSLMNSLNTKLEKLDLIVDTKIVTSENYRAFLSFFRKLIAFQEECLKVKQAELKDVSKESEQRNNEAAKIDEIRQQLKTTS
jgi:hypothetical protein